jgi:hypothetical protein
MKEARIIVDSVWGTAEGRLSLAPGKRVVSAISSWSKDEFNVSFSPEVIAQEIRQHEVHSEISNVIIALNAREPFPVRPSLSAGRKGRRKP